MLVALVVAGQPFFFAAMCAIGAGLLLDLLVVDRADESARVRGRTTIALAFLVAALALDLVSRAQASDYTALSWVSVVAWVVAAPTVFMVGLRNAPRRTPMEH